METVGVDQYLTEIGQLPLLEREEEVRLFGQVAAEKKERTKAVPDPRILEQGQQARQRLIERNLRLVVKTAKKYMGAGMDLDDLIQEGNIGLMTAVEQFDGERGYRFSTYATWWIFQSVSRALQERGKLIRLPIHLQEKLRRFIRTKHQLFQELGREATLEELCQALGFSEALLRDLVQLQATEGVLSLDAPFSGEDENCLGDILPDEEAPPEELAEMSALRRSVEELLSRLTEREAHVLRERFGFGDTSSQTLLEVSKKLGVSRERVRQVEAIALAKLRNRHPVHLLDYLD